MNKISIRLQKVIADLGISPYKLSKILNYKSPDSVYSALNGRSEISDNFFNRIHLSELPINIEWLKTGVGDSLNHLLLKGGYGNEVSCNGNSIYPANLSYDFIKELGLNLAIALDRSERSYILDVRRSGKLGLEFKFKICFIEDGKSYTDRYYTVIIDPDWRVISVFDFWLSGSIKLRCENLLAIDPLIIQRFVNAIVPTQNRVIELAKRNKEVCDFIEEEFLKESDSFKEVLRTDSRIDLKKHTW